MPKRTVVTRALVPASLAVAALGLPPVQAQQGVFRSVSETVPIYATVLDRDSRLVTDLTREHFEVYDNGQRQELTVFESDFQPITVVVMLDTSGSMTLLLDLLKIAAERFVLRLIPEDRALIGSFSDKIIISPGFTNDRDELTRILRDDIQFGNPTHLWDAIDESMSRLAGEPGRRVVLVFTDGADMTSRRVDYRDVYRRATTEEFMVYAIGLQSQYAGRTTKPDRNLRRLAEDTGGGYFELTRAADLNSTFTRVADELHRQYVLGFTPQVFDGRVHELEVKTTIPGMTVRARKSYLAARPGGSGGVPPAPAGVDRR